MYTRARNGNLIGRNVSTAIDEGLWSFFPSFFLSQWNDIYIYTYIVSSISFASTVGPLTIDETS